MDIWSAEKRSAVMARIRSKNTRPEILLRSRLFKEGFRYRINKKDLPGKPDIVLSKFKTIIFIHGCFWHQHKNCIDGKIPKSNIEFWTKKLNRNIERDKINSLNLKNAGWNVVIVWECEIMKNLNGIIDKIKQYLSLD